MNQTLPQYSAENTTNSIINVVGSFGRHEFLTNNPWTAIPTILILIIASVGGTLGNVLTLLAVAMSKRLKNIETIFMVNLAISDLYVTAIADPMSIVAKLEGEHFFDSVPKLCQAIASLCTISCVTSLTTIAMMSLNRYIFICYNQYYMKVFSKRNCKIICMALYSIGLILVLLNQAGIGDHSFDRKSMECIWNRMATYPYTVVFSVTLVWLPCIMIGVCYSRLYFFVRNHKKIIANYRLKANNTETNKKQSSPRLRLDVAKTLFLIYAVFVTFWAPFALIMVIDVNDSFSHEAHVYITTFAHLHPSINWLIYLKTQKKFAQAYRHILSCACFRGKDIDQEILTSNGQGNVLLRSSNGILGSRSQTATPTKRNVAIIEKSSGLKD